MQQKKIATKYTVLYLAAAVISAMFCGCSDGYSNEWLYREDVKTIYVKMFDSRSFRRGHEYVLTDAICKQVETRTPYKIVSDPDLADTVLTGQIGGIASGILASERETGSPLEREVIVMVRVSWKNLKTGELLINNESVNASASFSKWLEQDFDYAANVAANRVAQKIVELMEVSW